MRKNLLLTSLLLMVFVPFISAQSIVSTNPENKNVILEEFTGFHCTYCPDGHAVAQVIQNQHPNDVVLVNIHQGSYANPSGSEPDYRTPWGDAIAGQSGLAGYPAGTINRHLFPSMSQGSGTAMSRGDWSNASNQFLGQTSYLNVGCEAVINTLTRELTVNVEVYYTGDSPESTNLLNVAILQNNIYGPQTGGDAGNNYQHMHMLRHLLTGQWGVEISETSSGSLFSTTLTYSIPDNYTDVAVVLEDLEIIAFVSETHQEIISGVKGDLSFQSSETVLMLDPETQTVNTAEDFTTDILITEVENLGGYEFSIGFDPSYLQVNAVSLGDFIGSSGRTVFPLLESIDNTNGLIEFAVTTLGPNPPGPSGSGVMLNIEWTSAESVPEEVNTAITLEGVQVTTPNGTVLPVDLSHGTVVISPCYPMDFDCDCDVDIIDVTMAAYAYGTSLGDPDFNAAYDLDGDNDIDIIDITMVTYQYGWSCDQKSSSVTNTKDTEETALLEFSSAQIIDAENQIYERNIFIDHAEDLGAYEVLINFDPQKINVLEVNQGSIMESSKRELLEIENSIDESKGNITYAITSLGFEKVGGSGSGSLIKIRYQNYSNDLNAGLELVKIQLVKPNAEIIPFKLSTRNNSMVDHMMSIYPNPAKDEFSVEYSLSTKCDVQFVIYDIYGKMIHQANISGEEKGIRNINFENIKLDAGMYQVWMILDGQIVNSEKLIIYN